MKRTYEALFIFKHAILQQDWNEGSNFIDWKEKFLRKIASDDLPNNCCQSSLHVYLVAVGSCGSADSVWVDGGKESSLVPNLSGWKIYWNWLWPEIFLSLVCSLFSQKM